MSGIEQATNRSIKPYKSSEEYLYAMKEDLAEWLKDLYDIDIAVDNFLQVLETGAVLCHHANNVTRVAADFLHMFGEQALQIKMPTTEVSFISSAQPSTFLARDNISNFISWCRKQMDIQDVLMFETDDLVLRKNEKNFVLCLLEVARRASRFGMLPPVLIQLEQEIEEEIREELDLPQEETPLPKPQRCTTDFQNLDQMVQHLVSHCTCPTQFPMIKVSEGKYRVGESSTLIFVRILRNHVMVRVGGGWDTLEHYLDKHDPCRCTSIVHKQSKLASPQRAPTPVHELKTHLTPQKDGHMGAPATLLLGRTQSPLPPVHWTPTAPSWGQKSGIPSPRSTSSPNPGSRNAREQRLPSPNRQRERSATPSRRQTPSEAKGDSVHFASTRTGRDIKRTSPSPRRSSSLPRPIQPSPVSQPETARPKTPLVIQGAPNQMYHHPQPALDPRLAPSWTKSQFSSKLRQIITPGSRSLEVKNKGFNTQGQGGLGSAKALVPERCRSPIKNIHHRQKEATTTNQLAEDCRSPPEGAELICSFSPVKLARDEIWGEPPIRPLTPIRKIQRGHIAVAQLAQKKTTPDSIQGSPLNRDSEQMGKVGAENTRKDASRFQTSKRKPIQKDLVSFDVIEAEKLIQNPQEFQELMSKDGGKERGCLFTPPPITMAQEASLYQSLEQEIQSNLQLLSMESNENNFEVNLEPGSLETPENKQEDPSSLLPMLCEQSLSSLQYGAQDSAKQVGCDEPTNEPLAGRKAAIKVDVESWVATLPRSSRTTQPQPSSSEVDLGQPLVPKPCPMCSWSSVGSSLESKEVLTDLKRPQYSYHDGTLGTQKPNGMVDPAATSTTSSLGSTTENPLKPKAPSFKQNRTLKKPERVPSIYKLKLRPRVRPRRDHRPEKKPSKIPTPLSYRGQPTSDLQRAKGCTSGDSRGEKQSSLYSPLKTSKVGIQGSKVDICTSQHGYRQRLKFPRRKTPVPEVLFDQEQESWV